MTKARLYETWDERQLEEELGRRAVEQQCELEIVEVSPGVWRAALTHAHEIAGRATLQAVERAGDRGGAMRDLLWSLDNPI